MTALAQPLLLLSLVTLPVALVAQALPGTQATGSVSSQSCGSILSPGAAPCPLGDDSFSFSAQFVFLTYVLGVAWLGVFGFSAVPVFMFYNIWSTCEVIKSPQTNGTAAVEQICVDIRQYGIIPWNAFPGKICGSALENICNTNEFYMSYHLFIVACAGAGATVVALVSNNGPRPGLAQLPPSRL